MIEEVAFQKEVESLGKVKHGILTVLIDYVVVVSDLFDPIK